MDGHGFVRTGSRLIERPVVRVLTTIWPRGLNVIHSDGHVPPPEPNHADRHQRGGGEQQDQPVREHEPAAGSQPPRRVP
jgi:hypothetical protein